MKIICDENLFPGFVVTQMRPTQRSGTFFVKGTFSLQPNDVAVWADEPDMVSGDIYFDDDEESSLRYESDFAPFKPRADLLLVGKGHSPTGRPTLGCRVTFQVGSKAKSLAVFGNRYWKRIVRTISDPEPFTEMELCYENSFGGKGFKMNPVGKGYRKKRIKKGLRVRPLPNIENFKSPISSPSSQPEPASFAPLRKMWKQRYSKVGTYDKKWLKERWPWFPEDFDWSFFNAAPPDMQVKGYLRGDETLYFENLHPDYPQYKSRLPGLRVKCFLNESGLNNREQKYFREVHLNLDTLWVDMNVEKLVLVWRGVVNVRTMKLKEVEHLFILSESMSDRPRSLEEYRALLQQRIAESDEFYEENVSGAEIGAKDVHEDLDSELNEIEEEIKKGEAKITEMEAEAKERMIMSGVDPKLFDKESGPQTLAEARESIIAFVEEIKGANPEHAVGVGDLKEELAEIEELERTELELDQMEEEEEEPLTREMVKLAAARGESFAGKKMDALDLSGINFGGLDFHKASLMNSNLKGTNFSRANLSLVNIDGADLSESDLSGAVLDGTYLEDVILTNAKLTNLSITDATFCELDLKGADFSYSIGRGVDFSGSDLKGARFTGAKLPQADFSESILESADFNSAELPAAQFEGVKASGIKMQEADISGLHASGNSDFTGGNFKKVKGNGSIWEDAVLDGANFSSAHITNAQYPGASLHGALFNSAILANSVFDDACLQQAVLLNANLLRASFERTDLTGANFEGANIYEGGFCEAIIEGAKFSGANLKGTKLE